MMRCEVEEPEEQTIARYIGALRSEIADVVELQPYWTYKDVVKLAIKVERQIKQAPKGGNSRSWNKNVFPNRSNTSFPNPPFSNKVGPQKAKSKNIDAPKSSSPNTPTSDFRRCYKCHGLGHIASDYPNKKIVSLVEEDITGEEEDLVYDDKDEEEEITYADQGESLVARKCLSIQQDED